MLRSSLIQKLGKFIKVQ